MPTRRALAALLALPLPALAQRAPRRSVDPDVVFPEAGPRAWGQQMRQIRIGLLGGENEADRLGRFGAYRELIEQTFKVPARLYPASDYAGVIQAFGAKQLDIANMSPAAYAGAWLDTNGGVEPLVTTEESDGSISYVAVMLVRADSGITGIEGMRGKAMACVRSELRLRLPDPALLAAPAGHQPRGKYLRPHRLRRRARAGRHRGAAEAVRRGRHLGQRPGRGERGLHPRRPAGHGREGPAGHARAARHLAVRPDHQRAADRRAPNCPKPSRRTCGCSIWRCPGRIRTSTGRSNAAAAPATARSRPPTSNS